MKYINHKIKNWFSRDNISFLKADGENHGIIQFYTWLFEKTFHAKYIDDYPTIQSYIKSEHNITVVDTIPPEFENDLKKIIFYIDFLKSEGYLEVIPRLTLDNDIICCFDHIIINPSEDNSELLIDDLINQSVNESVGHARSLIQDSFVVDEKYLYEKLSSKDPQYILYLPYYFLMENLRTIIDPHIGVDYQNFRTIRRDKQIFLNSVYRGLIDKEVLYCDSRFKVFETLHSYFHFAWSLKEKLHNIFVRHYNSLFKTLLNEYLTKKGSRFNYKAYKNEKLEKYIETIKSEERYSIRIIFEIVKILLSAHQDMLLTNSSELASHTEFRFLRNILIELVLHNLTLVKIHELEDTDHNVSEERLEEFEWLKSHDVSFPDIRAGYRYRAGESITREALKLEDLKEILNNPANYDVFFKRTNIFEEAVHSLSDLLGHYKKYKKHFLALFPKLSEHREESHQLYMLMNSFRKVGLVVHVKLPGHECSKEGYERNWYAETFFWNDKTEKKRATEHYRKEYKFSQSHNKKKINDVWLHYLPLSIRGANSRTEKLIESEKEKHKE